MRPNSQATSMRLVGSGSSYLISNARGRNGGLGQCPLLAAVSTGGRNTLSLKEKVEWIAMRQGQGRGFSAVEKTELWDRWQRGETLKAIGRAFEKPSSSIYF